MNHQNPLPVHSWLLLAGSAISAGAMPACAEAAADAPSLPHSVAAAGPNPSTSAMSNATTEVAPQAETKSKPPVPKVELPEIPFDKSKLSGVLALDKMITEAAFLGAAAEQVGESFNALKLAAGTSLNGTVTDQVRALLVIIDAFETFESKGRPVADAASKRFLENYAGDDAFSSSYRETYFKAEEELDTVISDGVQRRATASALMNFYKMPPRTTLDYMTTQIEESRALREEAIHRVVDSAGTSLMVADFKKGQELANLLQSTKSTLDIVGRLDPKNEKLVEAHRQLDEKAASRTAEIEAARAKYRFPDRYKSDGVPANTTELEESLKKSLERRGHKVERVALASRWIAVRSALGIHMYSQIDFHVAVQSRIQEEANAGVLDVLYVTGKTGTDQKTPFGTCSAGTIAQMLATNL